jgi:hypothetical protein
VSCPSTGYLRPLNGLTKGQAPWSVNLVKCLGIRRVVGMRASGLVLLLFGTAIGLHGEVQIFTINPTLSSLTLQGTNFGGDAPLTGVAWQEQAAGSLVTGLSGWLAVDLGPTSIQFIAGSAVSATQTHVWQPGPGGATEAVVADYGGDVRIGGGFSSIHEIAAIRNLQFLIGGDPTSLSGGAFDATAATVTIPTNAGTALDYRAYGLVVLGARKDLGGFSTNNAGTAGKLSFFVEVQSLTLPIDITLPTISTAGGDTLLRFSGTIVASRGSILDPLLLKVRSPETPEQLTLVWGSFYKLQRATTLNPGDWTDIAQSAPIDLTLDGDAAYFRVVPK